MNQTEHDLAQLVPGISPFQVHNLDRYVTLLRTYNQKINLFSVRDMNHLWPRHIFPSIIIQSVDPIPIGASVIDIGSGAGLPALPLKIIRPDLDLVLAESARKKCLFLRKAIADLRLRKVSVLQARVNGRQNSGFLGRRFAVVTLRAVATLDIILEMSRPVLQPEGYILAWKGEQDVPDLRLLAQKTEFQYEILSVPSDLHSFSSKFKTLRIFKIRL